MGELIGRKRHPRILRLAVAKFEDSLGFHHLEKHFGLRRPKPREPLRQPNPPSLACRVVRTAPDASQKVWPGRCALNFRAHAVLPNSMRLLRLCAGLSLRPWSFVPADGLPSGEDKSKRSMSLPILIPGLRDAETAIQQSRCRFSDVEMRQTFELGSGNGTDGQDLLLLPCRSRKHRVGPNLASCLGKIDDLTKPHRRSAESQICLWICHFQSCE